MVLSDNDILKALESGDITIDPFRREMLHSASYLFTLGGRLFVPKKSGEVDARAPHVEYDEVVMGEEGYVLKPGEFLLGQTAEKLSVSRHVACFHDARTTLARIGLNVLQGSTFVEPGQAGSHETLEISNVGPSPVRIFPGMKIDKAVFVRLETPCDGDYIEIGAYAGQSTPEPRS